MNYNNLLAAVSDYIAFPWYTWVLLIFLLVLLGVWWMIRRKQGQ